MCRLVALSVADFVSPTQKSHENVDRLSPDFTDEAEKSKKCVLLVSEE